MLQLLHPRNVPRYSLLLYNRSYVSTRLLRSSSVPGVPSHSADSYFKDVDDTPPDDPTMHRVDAASDAAQRPYEPPSGQWSQAGVMTSEYKHVSKDEPYDVPTSTALEKGKKLRYGGTSYPKTNHPGGGPDDEATRRGGRKPERSP